MRKRTKKQTNKKKLPRHFPPKRRQQAVNYLSHGGKEKPSIRLVCSWMVEEVSPWSPPHCESRRREDNSVSWCGRINTPLLTSVQPHTCSSLHTDPVTNQMKEKLCMHSADKVTMETNIRCLLPPSLCIEILKKTIILNLLTACEPVSQVVKTHSMLLQHIVVNYKRFPAGSLQLFF